LAITYVCITDGENFIEYWGTLSGQAPPIRKENTDNGRAVQIGIELGDGQMMTEANGGEMTTEAGNAGMDDDSSNWWADDDSTYSGGRMMTGSSKWWADDDSS